MNSDSNMSGDWVWVVGPYTTPNYPYTVPAPIYYTYPTYPVQPQPPVCPGCGRCRHCGK